MDIFQHEVFGPVVAVTKAETDDEAIELANQAQYGLAVTLDTKGVSKAHRYARQLLCPCGINSILNVSCFFDNPSMECAIGIDPSLGSGNVGQKVGPNWLDRTAAPPVTYVPMQLQTDLCHGPT
ncbi:MAG: aldehyde dehydrogenase family protein [Rhodobacteraceae bacterium]|nr:aldehyde dehydrogenase family protein [Paracoccaceae bacterium]